MSGRPPSADYIPLIPWFGVFLLGMTAGQFLPISSRSEPKRWMQPIIWLGQHSLPFYLLHQLVVVGALYGIALLVS
jgi:uncharacterized membrane protein